MSIESNIRELEKRLARAAERSGRSPDEITLVAVTKTVPPQLIQEAFQVGIRHFGENRLQEAKEKIPQLGDLQPHPTWHLVGHLQTNKVKAAVEIFDLIESVDSVRLAELLNSRIQGKLPILLQVNVADEASKFGFAPAELPSALARINQLTNLEVKGLMTIAPLVDHPEEVRPIFRELRQLRDALGLEHLSMGMTDDFEVAVDEGATIVRIGRAIFQPY
jgi:hypothetical protein